MALLQQFEQGGRRYDARGLMALETEERLVAGDQKLSLARFGEGLAKETGSRPKAKQVTSTH